MNDESSISDYLSKPSITEAAHAKEDRRQDNLHRPTSPAFAKQQEAIEPESSTAPSTPAQTLSRGEFLRLLGVAAIGTANGALLQNYFHPAKEEKPSQAEINQLQAEADAAKFQFGILNDMLEAERQELENRAFHTITTNYEIITTQEKYFHGVVLIAPGATNQNTTPLVFNEITGQYQQLQHGVNILLANDLCRLNIPFSLTGFHLYNLSQLKILSKNSRGGVLSKTLNELNQRYGNPNWILNEYHQDSFDFKPLILDPIEAKQIGLQVKAGRCECTADYAIKAILELIDNQW